jgi:hypothetical protein
MQVPVIVTCECGRTIEANAGEDVRCECGRRYATELSAQQQAALLGLQTQMRIFARLGIGMVGLLALFGFLAIGRLAGVAFLALGMIGWWGLVQPAWRRRAVGRLAHLPPSSVRPL